MTFAILAGMGIGGAILLIATGLSPTPAPLHQALAQLGRSRPQRRSPSDDLDARLGAWLRRRSTLVERAIDAVRADLRVLRRDPDQQAAEIAAYAVVGFLWAPVVAAGAQVLGIGVPVLIPAWLAFGGAAGAVFLAVRQVRTKAREERAAFTHALSAYCDVVAMTASAGYELHAAVFDAARRGGGWPLIELRSALDRGFLAGERPWESLSQLGMDLGVDDLVDLGATLALAGDEGASIGDTLTSKARSIRERLVADTERNAASATERMAVPGTMVLIGFLWLLAYPALFLILQEANR
ncbi:MAG: type II secretion system F family protein [Acidimicrobiales bacterium]